MPPPVRASASERCPMVRDGPRPELAGHLADTGGCLHGGSSGRAAEAGGWSRPQVKAKGPGPELGGGTSLDGPGLPPYRHERRGT
jgi:hypothetical protein